MHTFVFTFFFFFLNAVPERDNVYFIFFHKYGCSLVSSKMFTVSP